MEGVLNLDKPPGLSSARAVARVKRLIPKGTKIGHAGTLDPFATGVLLLLIGKSTRLSERLMAEAKQYDATIKLGAITATLDPDSPEELRPLEAPPTREQLEQALSAQVGLISQMPPIFSALKVGGFRAYALARKGKPVELKPRQVQIHKIQLIHYEYPFAKIVVDCGRGTYIRAIARDLGEALHTGGYLTALRRTRVGQFHAEQAAQIDQLTAENLPSRLVQLAPIV